MNRYFTGLMVAALALWIMPAAAQKNTQAEAQLAAAKQKEAVEGDLPAAIKQYKEIVAKYAKTDRATAAMALVRMADLYQRLGDAESRRIYEQVVNEYKDQTNAVTLAQARLGKDSNAGPTSRTVWTPNSTLPGLHWGTISPDGRFLSYSNSDDVILHEIATGADRNLTRPNESVISGPLIPPWQRGPKDTPEESAISPDGTRIAYVLSLGQEKRYSLRLANLTGDPAPRTLFDNPEVYNLYLHDWSPDGKSIAVVLHRTDKTTVQIALVRVSDRFVRILKSVDWRGVGKMRFSPDGKYLGYDLPQSDTSKEADVFVLAVDGSGEIPAVKNLSNDGMIGWSPDGKWLLFASDRNGTTDLWAVAFTDGKPQGMPQRLRADIGPGFTPLGWGPSGALYYQTRHGGSGMSSVQVASLDFSTGRFSSVPAGTRGYQENTSEPVWSADGKSLAYLSELRDRGTEMTEMLVIRATDTGKTREVVVRLNQARNSTDFGITIQAWAPDGRSLLVYLLDPQFTIGGYYRVDAATGNASAVVLERPAKLTVGGLTGITWLPDGLSFLGNASFRQDGPKRAIYQVDAQTGNMIALVLNETSTNMNPTPSADGRRIYYRRATSETVAFIERDLTTGNERELIRRPFLGQVRLSQDGQHIATASTDPVSNSRVVLVIPTAGGEVRELMRVPSEVKVEDLNKTNLGQLVGIPAGSWASDGRSLLLRKDASDRRKEPEFWLVPLSGGDPKRVTGDASIRDISVSPDGRHFTYTITEPAPPATSEVAVLENFLPKTPKR